MTDALPRNIDKILQYLAMAAAGYTSGLKWNEEAKLKSDLMKHRAEWRTADADVIRKRLLELGMSPVDTRTVVDLVARAQAGKRLVPQASYRDFELRRSTDQ